jgi:hypothetical protein
MSNVEAWRLQELALLLEELTLVLESGRNPEWARVMEHFGYELERLRPAGRDSEAGLKSLIRSLELCLDAGGGFSRLVLEVSDSEEGAAVHRNFDRLRTALARAVEGIGQRVVESVH